MADVINKVILICLIFVELVIAPIAFTFQSQDAIAKRAIINECDIFLSQTADKASVSAADLDSLYMKLNSHGIMLNVEVERLVYAPVVNAEGILISNYIKDDAIVSMAQGEERLFMSGDLVRVQVEEIGTSATRRVLFSTLNLDTGKFKYTMAMPVQ